MWVVVVLAKNSFREGGDLLLDREGGDLMMFWVCFVLTFAHQGRE